MPTFEVTELNRPPRDPVGPGAIGNQPGGPGPGSRLRGLLYSSVALSSGGPAEADALVDLRLDQVIQAIIARQDEPEGLAELYRTPLRDPDAVRYRQEIFRDLADETVFGAVEGFASSIRHIRRRLSDLLEVSHRYRREGQFLDAAAIYCEAVRGLSDTAAALSGQIRSHGLQEFIAFLASYIDSADFHALASDTAARKAELEALTYCVRVRGLRVEVSRYEDQDDYGSQVEQVFRRFEQGEAKSYLVNYRTWPALGHLGSRILDSVARLFPEEFSALDAYCDRHAGFLHPAIEHFERELHFYLAYEAYIAPLRKAGLPFCLPAVSATSKQEAATATFDLALAGKLLQSGRPVVTNDFHLEGDERIFVVSGPNQGGKTTFARTFGQLHHLGSIGCPVPGSDCRLFLCERVFTLFEREEDRQAPTGKLEDNLRRASRILATATSDSVIIMNEPFSSTALVDASFLGAKAMTRLTQLGVLCVYVTFVDELASFGPSVVSLLATVVPDNPSERTYKIIRAPANGLAQALSLAEKYRVSYEQLKQRIAR